MNDTTISEIIDQATDEGTWIEAPFDAVVRNAKAAKGKAPSTATLHDPKSPGIKCQASFFGRSALDYEGSIVRFAGKGRQAKTYKGAAEIKVWDKASLTPIGDAPARTAAETPPSDSTPAGGQRKTNTPPPARTPEEAENHFHREMKKVGLLWLHSYQYACDLSAKVKGGLPPDQFQAAVASMFITAKDRGLLEKPPGLREPDGVAFKSFVFHKPAAPSPAEIEAEAKKRAEAAAAEEERRHKEEQEKQRRERENLDEDVPF